MNTTVAVTDHTNKFRCAAAQLKGTAAEGMGREKSRSGGSTLASFMLQQNKARASNTRAHTYMRTHNTHTPWAQYVPPDSDAWMPNKASRVISSVSSLKSAYTSRTPPVNRYREAPGHDACSLSFQCMRAVLVKKQPEHMP
eukprot:519383-Pelagomonas_calceolata.AAC.6